MIARESLDLYNISEFDLGDQAGLYAPPSQIHP